MDNVGKIHWLGHASFRVDGEDDVIYIDPWQLKEDPKPADLILITHDHRDHCSPEDVAKIQSETTVIVTIKDCVDKFSGELEVVKPGDKLEIRGVKIQAVPAYNLTKFRSPGVPFHPKGKGYVGFIIDVDGQNLLTTIDDCCDHTPSGGCFYCFLLQLLLKPSHLGLELLGLFEEISHVRFAFHAFVPP